jgi:NADPH-dependent glutamate synthase beta subunit-like oxidoreductase/Pyruvate/2-oxoacid:ferredoxin oxidoreductase delta subunit
MNSPILPPTTWTTGTTEAIKTGTWRAALPAYEKTPSPCRLACPVNGDIAHWMQQARMGDWHAAWTTLSENNPFPAVAGWVCHHPCESECNRAGYDGALAICALERHIGERALAEGWRYPKAPAGAGRIAIVGGGPSGLSAAYQLRRRGYAVTLFEAQAALGGLLRYGIPPYRLPREVLDGEIDRILALGVDVRLGVSFDSEEQFARLRETFDAVFLALGARAPKRLAQLDYAEPWVMDGAAYLALANAGQPPALGLRLAVIGGGSAAMDVARSARRAGHEVTVLALEAEAEMPAQREEVLEAKDEGVVLLDRAMLRSAARGGARLRLDCIRANFDHGRVDVIPGTEFRLEADAVVTAIGQDPQLAPLPALVRADGALLWTDARGATSSEGVFAGGDAASLQRFVTEAIGMGKRAALGIDRWLQGETAGLAAAPHAAQRPVPPGAINTFYHPSAPRVAGGRKAAEEIEQALAEAGRCFSCGECTFCDNCFNYCPDMAVRRVAGGYAIAEDYCKGCGLCVRECPTGSIVMREELR